VQVLLQKNAKVYMAARSTQKAHAAIEALKAETSREAIFLELDLSNLKNVRASAANFLRCVSSVDSDATSDGHAVARGSSMSSF
jgi:NADP-dependent 3-hydroxy acid dehydrogenase YdfG